MPAADPDTVPTILHPAGRLLWRSHRDVQLEVGGRRVVLEGAGSETVRHLLGTAPGPAPEDVVAVQRELIDAGMLWPAPRALGAPPASAPAAAAGGQTAPPIPDDDLRLSPPQPRLAAELTALSTRAGEGASELLSARRHCTVAVHGDGRAGPHVAAILAAAGVGRVHVSETAPARLHHSVPGGLAPGDEGVPISDAAARAIARAAPEVDCIPPPFGERPDLVVLAIDGPVDAERRDALHARDCAHLLVRLGSDAGAVGPLVLPGLTSCLRCADLHRLDRDPAWNALAVQLSLPHRAAAASQVALATVLAGAAAMQALDFLDGAHPASIEGSIEMHPPDWRMRRRTWPVHPDCDCMQTSRR